MRKISLVYAALCAWWLVKPASGEAWAEGDRPWMNPALPPDERAELVLARMTAAEKLSLLQSRIDSPEGEPMTGYVPGVPRLGIPPLRETNGSLGVAAPVDRGPADQATPLPCGLAMAATWNPSLAYAQGAVIGDEARRKGFNLVLGGGVNLARDPRSGRNFEYAGEDPLLAGTMVGAVIRGIEDQRVITTVKHFVLNDAETGRTVFDARIEPPALRQSDLLAFEIAIEHGGPGAVMCAYNRVNGVHACENDALLNGVLKRDWGFRGWVMSDWGAVHGTAVAAMGGLDQESGAEYDSVPFFGDRLAASVADGSVPQSRLDDMAHRILRTVFATGLTDLPRALGPLDVKNDAILAQRVAEEGIVLLRNRADQLPLPRTLRRVAVIGSHADVGVVAGGGSSMVDPVGGPALAIASPGGDRAGWLSEIVYDPSSPLRAIAARLPGARLDFADGADPLAAARLARRADAAIVFVTQRMAEGSDAPSLTLPGNQDRLVGEVAAANTRTIVVLETGNPVRMPWLRRVAAVIEAWYPGAGGGEAIAGVLFGEINPSGRLPITFPRSERQLPRRRIPGTSLAWGSPFTVEHPEGAEIGYRWFAARGITPLFPFGFGLSYTQFAYSRLAAAGGDGLIVSFDVTNTGRRPGSEVAQAYAMMPGGHPRGSRQRLIGWQKVALAPGETRRVTIRPDARLLAEFDDAEHGWRIANGVYQVMVGASARDMRLSSRIALADMRIEP